MRFCCDDRCSKQGGIDESKRSAAATTWMARYGNTARTDYQYDPLTFRLIHLFSTGKNGASIQDLQYHYDPVGNITEIRDQAQQTIYLKNAEVSPDARYVYDAIYRLTHAEAREHAGQLANPQPFRCGKQWHKVSAGRFSERFEREVRGQQVRDSIAPIRDNRES
jgi:YD repeat-containing protein